MYPKNFQDIISEFEKLPGVGNKTASRYAFTLLEKNIEDLDTIATKIKKLTEIKKCKKCGFLSEKDECNICRDETRDKSKLLVVAYPQDVVAIEKTGAYKGLYHVLNGLISSTKGIYPEDLNIENLINRINNITKEIIIATSPTLDGEMTALYLDKVLKKTNVTVTRIAHGLPMGSNLDYADDLTLIKALDNRRSIESK